MRKAACISIFIGMLCLSCSGLTASQMPPLALVLCIASSVVCIVGGSIVMTTKR